MCRPEDFPPYPPMVLWPVGLIGEMRRDVHARVLCPRCLRPLPMGYPGALSRADNLTEVCSSCGLEEAMRDFAGFTRENPATDWPLTLSRKASR